MTHLHALFGGAALGVIAKKYRTTAYYDRLAELRAIKADAVLAEHNEKWARHQVEAQIAKQCGAP